jgi:hypothetical protein
VKIEQRHTGETHSAGSVQAHPKRIRGKPAPLTEHGRDARSTGWREDQATAHGRDARATNGKRAGCLFYGTDKRAGCLGGHRPPLQDGGDKRAGCPFDQ